MVKDKWYIELQQKHIDMVIEEIERGIDRGDRVIIFPESIFPLFLNQSESLMTLLEALSNEITIIAVDYISMGIIILTQHIYLKMEHFR